ncbi:MAG: dihydrodipicolinate synthase family protein [Armatimonadetes bacterium]|nr:MAG: dihydrodipicolinate synthase family protein [Armatimonadota bacterium]
MKDYPRAMVAIVTPFDEDGNVDVAAHVHNVRHLSAQGCAGFVIAGSTGEGPYLEPGERGTLVSATRQAAEEAFIMCGINAESVRQGLSQITEAADAGADAVLVLTPGTLVRGNDDRISSFYTDIADAAPIPVLLYSNPNVTGYELPTGTVNELAEHRNIHGIKDSGGNPDRIDDHASAIETGFIVYPGASRALLESHRRGAYGAITASANYAFGLVAAASSGDPNGQAELDTVIAVVERHGIPGAKRAAAAAGINSGALRRPLSPVDSAIGAEIDAAVTSPQQH